MRACLIVVDYQNDFVTGSLGFPDAVKIGSGIRDRIERARQDGWDVIFTFDTHEEAYLDTHEGKKLPVKHCVRDTWGHELADPVEASAGDLILEKDSFGSPKLMHVLIEGKYDKVELCGLVADICVLANAAIARAALPEADIAVDASLTAAVDPHKLATALEAMEGIHIDIIKKAPRARSQELNVSEREP